MNQIVPSRRPPSWPANPDRWPDAGAPFGSDAGCDGAPVDFGLLLGALRRRAWLVVLVCAAASGIGWYMVRSRPQVYGARAVIQLAAARQQLTSGLVGSDNNQIRYGSSLLSQIEVLRSRTVAADVVDSEPLGLRVQTSGFPVSLLTNVQLDQDASSVPMDLSFMSGGIVVGADSSRLIPYGDAVNVGGAHFVIAKRPAANNGAVRVLPRDRAIDYMLGHLDAVPRDQTTLIDIAYTASDPAVAIRVVNRVARAYQAVNADMAQEQVRRRRVFIQEQLHRYDSLLTQAESALNTFRTTQQAYSSQEKFSARQAGLTDLQVQRQQLDGERRLADTLLSRLEESDSAGRLEAFRTITSWPGMESDPSVADLHKQLLDYLTQRAELTSGPSAKAASNPDVQRLDALITNTENQAIAAVQAHIGLLDTRIASLDEQRNDLTGALRDLPNEQGKETRLSQNAQTLAEQAALLRTEYQHARIAEAAEVGQVELLDLASRSYTTPNQGARVILFAAFLGLMLGGGGAVLIEKIDTTVKRREELEDRLGLPVLATIPQVESAESGVRRIPLPRSRAERLRRDTAFRRSVALASATQRRSPNSEAYRQLRTNIFFGRDDERLHTLVITSPSEGDGKTSVAANLAISLAHQGRRVLLVDCDLHNPKLQRIFQVPVAPGLGEVILKAVPPAETIRATDTEGLFVMTAGGISPDEGEPVGSSRMRVLLAELSGDFDAVILDCAPVLAVSDSAILGVDADAVLLVVRAGSTTPPDAIEALRNLTTVGARVVGAVLNDPDGRVKRYGGYCYGYPRK